MNAPDKPWRGKAKRLVAVNVAVDRELEDYTRRAAAMQERASILIGAATVVGAIQFGAALTAFTAVQLAFALAAAVLGIVVVFPRGGQAFNARTMWNETYKGTSASEVLHHTVRVKLDNLDDDEKSLKRRGRVAGVGFIFLGASVFAALLGVVFSLAVGTPSGSAPTPTSPVSSSVTP